MSMANTGSAVTDGPNQYVQVRRADLYGVDVWVVPSGANLFERPPRVAQRHGLAIVRCRLRIQEADPVLPLISDAEPS